MSVLGNKSKAYHLNIYYSLNLQLYTSYPMLNKYVALHRKLFFINININTTNDAIEIHYKNVKNTFKHYSFLLHSNFKEISF